MKNFDFSGGGLVERELPEIGNSSGAGEIVATGEQNALPGDERVRREEPATGYAARFCRCLSMQVATTRVTLLYSYRQSLLLPESECFSRFGRVIGGSYCCYADSAR